jgi:GT2 family glycosyltransferase
MDAFICHLIKEYSRLGGMSELFERIATSYKIYGIEGIWNSGMLLMKNALGRRNYAAWIRKYDFIGTEERAEYLARVRALSNPPLISVLMPVYQPRMEWLREAVQSVQGQIYPHWELCIADDASACKEVREYLEGLAKEDSKIKVCILESRGGIARATNAALGMATGDWIMFLDHDDLLSSNALSEIAISLHSDKCLKLVYSDEDKITKRGRRFAPYFKPDWSPDLLLSQNYICHLVAVRSDLIREVGGIREGFDGAQDWDFLLRVTERCLAEEIHHIAKVLYHWRVHRKSTARSVKSKPAVTDASVHALKEACDRRSIKVLGVERMKRGGHFKIKRTLPNPLPQVSVIIPVRNKPRLLEKCLRGLLEKTDYPNLEILVVDNDSDDPEMEKIYSREKEKIRLFRHPGSFNYSEINNMAAREARGEVLLLLNNDVEPLEFGWLSEMVSHAIRPDIGAVGAMLLYPNGRVQHAGVTLGIAGPMRVGGVAGHPGKHMHPEATVMGNLLRVTRNVSAVTGACLAIRKEVYLQVGGFDEKELTIAFNDVDFCIRVMKAGYLNLWTPHARLTHHESLSRGVEDTPEKKARFHREVAVMRERWGELLDNDPYYNPNLTLVHEDWSVAFPPRGYGRRRC